MTINRIDLRRIIPIRQASEEDLDKWESDAEKLYDRTRLQRFEVDREEFIYGTIMTRYAEHLDKERQQRSLMRGL